MFQIEIVAGVVGFAAAIAWLIRLEAKVLYLDKDHQAKAHSDQVMVDKLWGKFDELNNTLTDLKVTLAVLNTKLGSEVKKDEKS